MSDVTVAAIQRSSQELGDDLHALILREYENCGKDTDPEYRRYLKSRMAKNAIRRAVDVFQYYLPYLPKKGNILDWGCGIGAESFMMRQSLGTEVNLYGSDIDAGKYPVMRECSGMEYKQLTHPYLLPYPDGFFDAFIGSGVLEHVVMDNESLKEIHRVMRPEGTLVISFLPNRYSYTESIARKLHRGGHQRTYTLKSFDSQLRHTGFLPLVARYHQFIPAATVSAASPFYISLAGKLWFLNRALEHAWPTRLVCTNLMFVARAASVFY